MRSRCRLTFLMMCLSLLPAYARAQGHNLHGAGPLNSPMGGAGTALLVDSVGALMFNPALLAGVKGNQITFSTEFFQDSIRFETTIDDQTGFQGPTQHLGVEPAFGWMSRHPRRSWHWGSA